jgi:hypothetical protein
MESLLYQMRDAPALLRRVAAKVYSSVLPITTVGSGRDLGSVLRRKTDVRWAVSPAHHHFN